MLNLKLAEYDLAIGRFLGFIDQAKADYAIRGEYKDNFLSSGSGFVFGKNFVQVEKFDDSKDDDIFLKDETDPLNRFNGLFNGRTYGEGRFVLIDKLEDGWRDDVVKLSDSRREWYLLIGLEYDDVICPDETSGNLHENPELWEKVK